MQAEKTVYIVRHGQSVDNSQPVFQAYDSPLSMDGVKQSKLIAERVTHIQFDALIASPQARAQQTAQAINEATGKSIETNELFIERFKPSSIDGKSWHDTAANETWRKWEKSLVTPGLTVEDGENFSAIVQRADDALQFLERRTEQSLLVVSHGHFIRTIIARILLGDALTGETLQRFYTLTSLENTALTVITFKPAFEEEFRWRLWTLNDHAHFAE